MSDFFLTNYEPCLKTVWDEVVLSSKNGSFMHLRDFMDYHAHRFDEQSLIVHRKGKPVAVFPCNRQGDLVISHGGLTYGGLVYSNDLHVTEVVQIMRKLIAHYKSIGAHTLRYKAVPHIFHRYPSEEDLYALFLQNAKLIRRDLSTAILLENRIKPSVLRNRKARKAEQFGVEFSEGGSLNEFHCLLKHVLQKFGTSPVHTLDELNLLFSRFPKNIRLFSATNSRELYAAVMVFDFGNVAHSQYIASSDKGREFGALDLIFTKLLDDVFADRKYFSFGISTEHDGRLLNEGLIFQKEGFGGRAVLHDFYEVNLIA